MRSFTLLSTFLVVFVTFSVSYARISSQNSVDSKSCRPDWDNQCDKSSECCSGNCKRDDPKWATGVCRPNDGSSTTKNPRTTRKPKTTKGPRTTTTAPAPTNDPNRQSGRGECSWYGADNEIPPGSYTSCGDIFDREAMATAQLPGLSPKLKCGTKVRVTNERNGKTVDVVVNDSGTHAGRILDLTYAAFGKIEDRDKGVTPCSYVVIS